MTKAPDKGIFDAFRLLTGPVDSNEFRLIKKAIGELDKTGEDHELFRVLGLIDDDDTITPYEFETLKQAVVAYKASDENHTAAQVPYVSPDAAKYGSSLRSMITVKVMQELLHHEAMVLEAYRDSRRIWTWGVGIATTSGFDVKQYKDNPQPVETVIKAYVDMLIQKYAPDVLKAFSSVTLTEYEFAAALSFHYNTGAILRAHWVKHFLKGNKTAALQSFMNWSKPPEIMKRRKAERDLFFDAVWTSDGKATVYPVRKPGYNPDWRNAKRIDVRDQLKAAIA